MTFIDGLYVEQLQRGIQYFFPAATWTPLGTASQIREPFVCEQTKRHSLELEWVGQKYLVTHPSQAFSQAQIKLVQSIAAVLTTRYQLIYNAPLAAQSYRMFRGMPEDRYIAAFLDSAPYQSAETLTRVPDRVSEAIGVLRISSSSTYENRRIETGALLFGSQPDSCHELPSLPEGALRYSSDLTPIRSFHRLCDGLQTLALVDRDGLLVEIVDVHEWAKPFQSQTLPVPIASRYLAHGKATLCGGHTCLVLTPSGEIKIFGEGLELFRFVDGRWHLTDARTKYEQWETAVGDSRLAECLFQAALNLAEERRGGLFVVLRNPEDAAELLMPGDVLNAPVTDGSSREGKRQLHYLLRGARALDLPPSVLESIARIDGAIVMDRESNILTFGAILRAFAPRSGVVEGGRTTAALAASRYADVLKISEDGLIEFYTEEQCAWEL